MCKTDKVKASKSPVVWRHSVRQCQAIIWATAATMRQKHALLQPTDAAGLCWCRWSTGRMWASGMRQPSQHKLGVDGSQSSLVVTIY